MSEQQPQRRYRLQATRFDGTRTTLMGGMGWEEAKRAHDAVRDARIFSEVQIVPERNLSDSQPAAD